MREKDFSREPERLMESLMENRDRLSRLRVLQALTDLYLDADSYEAARECIEEVLAQSAQLALSQEERGILLYQLGRALRAMARLPEAAKRTEQAREALRDCGSRYLVVHHMLQLLCSLSTGCQAN